MALFPDRLAKYSRQQKRRSTTGSALLLFRRSIGSYPTFSRAKTLTIARRGVSASLMLACGRLMVCAGLGSHGSGILPFAIAQMAVKLQMSVADTAFSTGFLPAVGKYLTIEYTVNFECCLALAVSLWGECCYVSHTCILSVCD